MAAQVDATAQCPPETFRPSAQKVHGTGLLRRPPSLPFPDSGMHTWRHSAPKRSAEAAHAPVHSPLLPATDAKHRNTPDPTPGTVSLPPGTTSPVTSAATAASGLDAVPYSNVPRTERSSHEGSADAPPRAAPRPFAPQAPMSTRPLQSSTSICLDAAANLPQPQGIGLKRRRDSSDVDGTDTGTWSRKKRRLRRFLITSRLSQPFSLPASHILNRESLATGDKRFLKMAAIMNARRIVPLLAPPLSTPSGASTRLPPGPPTAVSAPAHYPANTGTLLHRAAMANQLRKRLFEEVAATGRPILTRDVPAQLMASARFSAVSAGGTAGRATTVPAGAASLLSLPRVPAGFRSAVFQPLAHPAAVRTGQATGLVPAPIAMRISPRLRPVPDCSPVPSLCLHKDDEEHKGDGDGNGPHDDDDDDDGDSDGDSERYDYGASDDPEDVYADFSVLFGGGSDDEWDEEGIDDIMDELDGIAHLPKKGVN